MQTIQEKMGGGEKTSIIDKYVGVLESSRRFNQEQLSRIQYAAESIFNDITKILLYILLSVIFRKTAFVVGFLLSMLSLRPALGGIHRRTYWGCFFYSLGMMGIGFLINQIVRDYNGLNEAIAIGMCIIGTIMGPAISKYKRNQTEEDKKRKRIAAILIQALLFVIYMIFRKGEFGIGLLIGLIMEHGQVVFLGIKSKKQGREIKQWKNS